MAIGLTDQLRQEFSGKGKGVGLHYAMAHHTYKDMAELSQRVDALEEDVLCCKEGSGEWTPLQVAVITGFRLGVECLMRKGVQPSKEAIDYAQVHHPEFIPLLEGSVLLHKAPEASDESLSPHKIPEDRLTCLRKGFGISFTLPETPFTYQAGTNDFGIEIKELLLACDTTDEALAGASSSSASSGYDLDVRARNLNADMISLGEILGFKVTLTGQSYFPRDHFVPHPEYGFLGGASGNSEAATPAQIQRAIDLGISFQVRMERHAAGASDHYCFGGVCGSTARVGGAPRSDYRRIFNKDFRVGGLYFEGGNMYRVTNREGEVHALVGSSLLGTNLALGHLAKTFQGYIDGQEKSGKTVTFPSVFKNREIYRLIEEMFALGRIKISGKGGSIARKDVGILVERRRKGSLKSLAIQEKKMVPLSQVKITPEKDLSKYGETSLVRRYAYDRQALSKLFEMILGLKRGRVHFLPQLGYHLDTFMRPGPKATGLIQDYAVVKHFLEIIQSNHEVYELTELDREILERYIVTAQELDSELKGLEYQCSAVLQQAGIKQTIPIPAVFYDASLEREKKPTYHVNFMNGISGFSKKTGKYYYITTGAEVGDNLGKALMDVFTFYFQQILPEIEVYFVGRDPSNPNGFSEPMRYWNCLGDSASNSGLHCMSVEVKTASHTHK